MLKNRKLVLLSRILIVSVSTIAIIVILWIDANTTIWQNRVILSGIAASTVSFLGTYLVVTLVLDRIKEKRWAPVTGLALADIMLSLADDNQSEITRGVIVPRSIKMPALAEINIKGSSTALEGILVSIQEERSALTQRLARWSQFLASSGSNDEIMQHVASASLQLERLRDAILIADRTDTITQTEYQGLTVEAQKYNDHLLDLVQEIEERLKSYKVTK